MMAPKRFEFKVCDIFDREDDGHIAILRMLAACNDLNAIALLLFEKNIYEQFDTKEICEGVHTYLFRIMCSHIVEAKNAFSSFLCSSTGNELIETIKKKELWNEVSEAYDNLVSFFETPSDLFVLIREKIRHGVGFHYKGDVFKKIITGAAGQKESLYVGEETTQDSRYTFIDDIVAFPITEVLNYKKEKYDELTKPVGSLNKFCGALLGVLLSEKITKIKEV